MSLLAIDPSIVECGWAIGDAREPVASGVIRPPEAESMALRLFYLVNEVERIAKSRGDILVTDAIVEVPEKITYNRVRGRSGGSLIAESIGKLNQTIGAITVTLMRLGINVHHAGATLWKGNMDKDTAKLLAGKKNHNEADAVILYRWYRTVGHLALAAQSHKPPAARASRRRACKAGTDRC